MKKSLTNKKLILVATAAVLLALTIVLVWLFSRNDTFTPTQEASESVTDEIEIAKIDPTIQIAENERQTVLVTANSTLPETEHLKIIREYENLPLVLVEVDAEGLRWLENNDAVESVSKNITLEPLDNLPHGETTTSIPIDGQSVNGPDPVSTIGGNISPSVPYYTDNDNYRYNGSAGGSDGYEVVVIDSGVDYNHPSLAGKVVAEACFSSSTNGAYVDGVKIDSVCPNGDLSSSVSGSGIDCDIAGACGHGTMVAGSIAMDKVNLQNNVITSGSAPAAKIIAMKTASQYTYQDISDEPCGEAGVATCFSYFQFSDILAAVDYTITLAQSRPKIAAVNLSLGGGAFSSSSVCRTTYGATYNRFKEAVDILKSMGIATVIANGNEGYQQNQAKIAFPACVEGVVAVGSTSIDGTHMAYYSQNGPLTTLLAPGGDYTDGTFGYMWLPLRGTNSFMGSQGTSFASPVTAGAYAVLRSKWPNMSVEEMTDLLKNTGTLLTDSRSGYNNLKKPLINIAAALKSGVSPLASSSYTISGNDIQLDEPVSIASLMSDLDTPYGYQIKNGATVVYESGPTPYSTAQSLPKATTAVDDNWTLSTVSHPTNTYTPLSYTIEIQDTPPPPSENPVETDLIVNVDSVISLKLNKGTAKVSVTPSLTGVIGYDKVEVTVDTNYDNGYTLGLSASQPSLVCQSNSSYTISTLASAGSLSNGRWGYGLGSASNPPATWRGVGVVPSVFDTITTSPINHTSYLYFGTKVNILTQACSSYKTQTVVTATPRP